MIEIHLLQILSDEHVITVITLVWPFCLDPLVTLGLLISAEMDIPSSSSTNPRSATQPGRLYVDMK